MYRTFVDFGIRGKKYFYEGNDIIKAMRTQAELWERYKDDDNVYSVGYEMGETIKGKCVIHK